MAAVLTPLSGFESGVWRRCESIAGGRDDGGFMGRGPARQGVSPPSGTQRRGTGPGRPVPVGRGGVRRAPGSPGCLFVSKKGGKPSRAAKSVIRWPPLGSALSAFAASASGGRAAATPSPDRERIPRSPAARPARGRWAWSPRRLQCRRRRCLHDWRRAGFPLEPHPAAASDRLAVAPSPAAGWAEYGAGLAGGEQVASARSNSAGGGAGFQRVRRGQPR